MNVLLTSAGRRTYMVEYFKEVLKPYHGKVYAINSNLDAPALWIADGYEQAPLIHSDSYPQFIEEYCIKNGIQLVISLFDIDLPILSKLKERFLVLGITIVVADSWVVEMANDKWATYQFLKRHQFNTVLTYKSIASFKCDFDHGKVDFPVFIKPRWGMGSIGLYKAENFEELNFYYKSVKKEIEQSYLYFESKLTPNESVLIQAQLPGKEYGLDIINNLKGEYQTTIVKQKLAMRSGETDSAVIVEEPILSELGENIAKKLKHPAIIDVDVFFDGKTPYVLEINARFGGGYPFSHAAGVNLPEAIIKWHLSKPVVISELLTAKNNIKSMKGIMIVSQEQL